MRAGVAFGVFGVAGLVAAAAPGCLDPTEIELDIGTNACSSLAHVDIYLGSPEAGVASAPSTVATTCADASSGDIGSIVITPSGAGQSVAIAVVATLQGGTCTPGSSANPSCIIARRSVTFSPHTPLKIPIFLDGACAGVDCGADTCEVVKGVPTCVSTCQSGCTSDAGPAIDASPPLADVIAQTDAPTLQCVAPQPTPTVNAYWVWSFVTNSTSTLQDDMKTVTEPFAAGSGIKSDTASPCSSFLHVTSGVQELAPEQGPLDGGRVAVTTWYRAQPNTNGTIFALKDLNASLASANRLVVTATGTLDFMVTDTTTTADGTWHFLYVDVDTVSTHTFDVYRDGNHVGQGTIPGLYVNAGPLTVGPNVDVDQLQFFSYGLVN